MKRKMLNRIIVTPLLLATLALGACSSQSQIEGEGAAVAAVPTKERVAPAGPKSGTVAGGGASGVNSSESRGSGRVNNNPYDSNDISLAGLNDPNNLLSQRVIYFDYDQSAIRPEYMILINTHAKLVAKYPQIRMRLEGHADERGSRGYNVALSESRAKSVRSIMGAQGARASQIKTIGYGEEVPVVTGHSKNSWKKNRRVEIKYENY